jgi:multidrug efflux pump subunit AcrB
LIWRRDRLPTITVQADLSPGIEAKTVTMQLASKMAAFARTLPAGYRIETGGTADASAKGLGSVIAVVYVTWFRIPETPAAATTVDASAAAK